MIHKHILLYYLLHQLKKILRALNTKNKSELSKIVAEKLAKKAQEKKITKIYL